MLIIFCSVNTIQKSDIHHYSASTISSPSVLSQALEKFHYCTKDIIVRIQNLTQVENGWSSFKPVPGYLSSCPLLFYFQLTWNIASRKYKLKLDHKVVSMHF